MRVLCVLVLLGLAVLGQTPTIDQSLALKSASAPKISPDGRFVSYLVNETSWEENEFVSQIWIAMTATGERYQLTHNKKASASVEWSSDSRQVAFLSDRDGKQQIWVISPTGGEAAQLTSVDTGVAAFKWSPDGKSIAYTSSGPESKSRKERKEKYGEFEVVKNDYTLNHLWLIPVPEDLKEKPKPEQLTQSHSFTVNQFSWSPDSKRIAFAATRDPDLSSQDTSDIYVLRLSDKFLKKLVETRGPDRNPLWSPDGSEIAFETAAGQDVHFYKNSHIGVVAADGGAPRVLGEKFDEDPHLVEWSPSGIYFEALQRTSSQLFKLHPENGKTERVSAPEAAANSQASFTRDFKTVAFTCVSPGAYSEICVSPVAHFAPKPVTNMADQLKPFTLARRELIEWKSKDGTPIEGVLIKPADFDPMKKYPLLVVIHGGPTGVDRPVIQADRYYPVEMFVAKGAIVLKPNYRGSAGYGEKFRSLNVRNLGLGDYDDVISGVDALIAKGYVDKNRVGAMGWSQGGYISAFITTYSDRFKAVSVGAGISDWMTYYVNTDIHPFTRQYLQATPWDDPEIYRKTSPISYIATAKTPTLIQHGELDKRVPIPNAYELYQALEDRGVPVKMYVYKGFGHGINKPRQQRAVMEHNYEWFSQWIWGEKPVHLAE